MLFASESSRERGGDRRGTVLLLDHCAVLERLEGGPARSARERLEAKLGSELTRRLLGTLCADGPAAIRA